MLPILLDIPALGLRIYSYGVFYTLAYIVAIWAMARIGHAWQGQPKRVFYTVGVLTVVGGVVGGGFTQFLVDLSTHSGHGEALGATAVGRAAGVFLGGVILSTLLVWVYTRFKGYGTWHTLDVLFTVIPLGLAIGRVGCFLSGCCWGKACDLPWAVTFSEETHQLRGVPAGVPLHPAQLYAVAANLALFGGLMALLRWKRFPGQVSLVYFAGYGVIRFLLEMVRDDVRGTVVFGLSTSQTISIVMIVFALALWPVLRRFPLPEMPERSKGGGSSGRRKKKGTKGEK